MRNAALGKHTPSNLGSFVAPSASVVGNVSIGEHSSVWYNAVLRGELIYSLSGFRKCTSIYEYYVWSYVPPHAAYICLNRENL